jgi:hypothetical protein
MSRASLAKTAVLLLLFVLGAVPISAGANSPVPDPPWLKPPRSTVEARLPEAGEPGRLKKVRAPQVATDAKMADPGYEDPGYCGDGACDSNEEWCTDDCGGPPPPASCSGLNLRAVNVVDNDTAGPSPATGGNCDCVVRIDTWRRAVRGHDLYQECGTANYFSDGHYGHGSCPSCRDFPHDAPLGRWGVEIITPTVSSTLASATTSEPSLAQDYLQWPSSRTPENDPEGRHLGDWNSCTCDTQHFAAAEQESLFSARAGWFKILSSSQTCAPLASQSLNVGFTLKLWELDPGITRDQGDDDLIAEFTRNANFNGLYCEALNGFCTGSVPVNFQNPSGSVIGDGHVSIECRSDPWQEENEDENCYNACSEYGLICLGGRCSMSPVLIDVQGNGFNLTDTDSGVEFDLNADGIRERVSWTSVFSDDGFLTLDRNGNGVVDGGRELFGSVAPQPEPPGGVLRNGFNALKPYDRPENGGNSDDVIDDHDAIFASLRLWQDTNHNGLSEATELSTLQALDLKSIDLKYKESKRVDEHGNHFRYRAKVDDVHGAHVNRWAWDVFFLIRD